jgi:peptidoglycan/LPS O-acetylase OafA/YrhL
MIVERVSALDGLRGVAALLVVVFHFRHFGPWFGLPWSEGSEFLHKSYLWVDLFFVLSGFVLAHVYVHSFRRGFPRWQQVRAFWWARFARVYPLHLAALLLLVGLVAVGFIQPLGHDGRCYDVRNLAASLGLVHVWGLTNGLCWNVPSWSIAAEAAAYALFPWLVPLVMGIPRRWGWLVPVACIAGLSALALMAGNGGLNLHYDLGAVRCLPSFILGIWIFHEKEAATGWQRAMQTDTGCLLAGVSVILLMHHGAPDVLTVTAMALVVAGMAGNRGTPGRMFGTLPFVWLGAISYAVYMLHWPLLLVMASLLELWLPAQEEPLARPVRAMLYAVYFSVLLAVSTAAHHLLELPARRRLRNGWAWPRRFQRV